MNRDLLNELAKLRQRHGSEFDDAIRLIADGELPMPSPQGRGRKKVYNKSTLESIWVLVETKRRLKKLSINSACAAIMRKGGLFTEKIEHGKERRHEIKGGNIRSIYYKAKKLLDENPTLRNEWEYMLELRLESHRSKRSLFDIFLERFLTDTPKQVPSPRKLLRK